MGIFDQPTDQDALRLTHSIALAETGANGKPDYSNTTGDAGTSKGAYQWQPGNFEAAAKSAGLDPTDFSPTNQDKVAYSEVKGYKDKGYDPGQIASLWNSGSPNNWQNHSGSTVINGKTIHYDTPAYVKKVQQEYQKLQSSQNQGQSGGVIPTAQASTGDAQPDQGNFAQKAAGMANSAINFFAPSYGDLGAAIQGKTDKSALQLLGDAGTTALSLGTLIPGLGEGILAAKGVDAAVEGANLASKAAPGLLGTVAKNAALGAGFGTTGALGAGETDPSQILQSAGGGAVLGGALGAAGKYVSGKISNLATKGETRLNTLTGRTKALTNAFKDNSRGATADGISSATNPIKTLQTTTMENGKPLASLLTVDGSRVNVDALTNENYTGALDSLIQGHGEDASALIDTLPGGVPIETLEQQIQKEIESDPTIRGTGKVPAAIAQAKKIIDSFKVSYGDNIPYKALDEIRAKMNGVYNEDTRDVARIFGDVARSNLYNGSGTNKAIKAAMASEAELIRARNYVQKLNRAVVPGGQLGKYFADMIGAYGGSLVGGAVGGPFGAGLGLAAGGALTNKAVGIAQRSYFTPIGSKTAGVVSGLLKSKAGQVATGATKAGLLRLGTK